MNNDDKFNDLLDGFNEWHSRFGWDWQTYNPIIAALEVENEPNRSVVLGLSDTDTPQRLTEGQWKIASSIYTTGLFTLKSVTSELRAFSAATMRLLLCRVTASHNRREAFDFVNEASRVLLPGGAIFIEQVYASDRRGGREVEAFLFLEYALKSAGLVISDVFAPFAGEQKAESRITLVCLRPFDEGGAISSRLEEAIQLVRSYRQSLFALNNRPQFEAASDSSKELTEITARLKSDMLASESALAALSETALGTADMGRRLLKVERRILEIRKQTSILYPITYPWSRFVSVALAHLKKAKERRRQRRQRPLKSDLASDEKDATRVGPTVIHPKARVLDETPRILVLKLDHIGDFLLAIPAIKLLREAWPSAHMTLVCSPTNEGLARSAGLFEEVRVFKFTPEMSEDVKKVDRKMYSSISSVVSDEFDLAIDLRHDPDSRPFMGVVNATMRAGFEAHGKFYTPLDITVPSLPTQNGLHRSIHAVHRLMLLASHVVNNLKPLPFDQVGSRLASVEASLDFADVGSFVVFAPGGGTRAKKWSPERFAELAKLVVKHHGMKVVVVGGPAEAEYAAAIGSIIPATAFVDLVGKLPLVNVPMVLTNACALVGTDTGVTHLSALLGKPTIAVFSGVADMNTWHPMGEQVTVIRAPTACSPCQIAKLEQCVADHVCMTAIDVETAYRALSAYLTSRTSG